MFGGKRWRFTASALFILCLRNFLLAAASQRRSYFNKVPIRKTLSASTKPIKSMDFIDNDFNFSPAKPEPGFNLTDEEIKKHKMWPGGDIPYYIDEYSFDKVFRDRLRHFLDVTNSATGLNFLELHRAPGDDETRWVLFINRQGLLDCAEQPLKDFTNYGVQKVALGYDCLSNGGSLAGIVLALVGVPPQHNAPNRNEYIEIIKDNIIPGRADLFEILKDNEWLFHDVEYDYASAGHYNQHKYTNNGKATLKPVKDVHVTIGEGKGFSNTDILKIKMMYNYISKKRKSLSAPECEKLFDRRPNFNDGDGMIVSIEGEDEEIEPREMPSKYLGLAVKPKSTKNLTESEKANSKKALENTAEYYEYDNEKVKSEENMNYERGSESNENTSNFSKKENEEFKDGDSVAQSDSKADGTKTTHLKFTNPFSVSKRMG